MKTEKLSNTITIINADCHAVLPVECDAVVTDPPYGINKAEWDNKFNTADIAMWLSFAATVCVVPGVWALGRCIEAMGDKYVWTVAGYKPAAMTNGRIGLNKWQPAVLGGLVPRCGADAFQFHPTDVGLVGHPCQKPEQFMVWLVSRVTPECATVLDPYMGSGTTGIACIRTGRRFIGIEVDEQHYQTARRRLLNELAQTNLFRQDEGGALEAAEGPGTACNSDSMPCQQLTLDF